MNETDTQRFNELYRRFEAGDCAEALQGLRNLAGTVDDPWDKAELLYHETMFLLAMNNVPGARERLEDLKKAVASLTEPPQDGYEIDVSISVPVMALSAGVEVSVAEGKGAEALRLLEDLVTQYPKQLSTPDFRQISNEIKTHRGMLLANAERWAEARPFLEEACPPERWKSVLCYYLGHCYYTHGEYERASDKLTEALNRGLTGRRVGAAHYILGLAQYHLSDMEAAKCQFELSVKTADPEYLQQTRIWEWLEATSRNLRLYAEADNYRKARLNSPPESKPN